MTAELAAQHGAKAWHGADLDPAEWHVDCSAEQLAELSALVDRLDGCTLDTVTADDFNTPAMRDLADRVTRMLNDGPGIALVRTWPVAQWGIESVGMLFWGLGTLLGTPLPQTARGERLSAVTREVTSDARLRESSRRGSRSDAEIDFHTENALPPRPPRLIALLCCREAREGGESAFVSGVTLYNTLLARQPELARQLARPFSFGRQEGDWPDGRSSDESPVFDFESDRLRVRFNRYWMERGVDQAGGWSDGQRAAVEAFEAAAHDEGVCLEHPLRVGEMVFVDNRSVLHARRKFVDHSDDDPSRNRMLWRLWCS